MEERILRLRITGLVQGVGFRAFVEDWARRVSARGWVRNRRDGSVEALVAGPPEVVGEMVAACRRGPPGADVAGVELELADGAALGGDQSGGGRFSVLPTA